MTRGPSEAELFDAVRAQPVPEHVAIIMDGNGRWATHRGLPRVAGHHEGVKSARSIVRAASALGLRYLTLYAFSTENWSRPPDEVSMLMSLLERSVNAELPELMARNARLRVLGRPHGLPAGVRRGIDHVVHETRHNTGLTVLMAFDYGARDELTDAFRSLAREVARVSVGEVGSGSRAWKRVGSAVVLIPVFVWVTTGAPTWVFQLLVIAASAAACAELARMFERTGRPISTWLTVGVGAALTASFATSLYAGLGDDGKPLRWMPTPELALVLGIGLICSAPLWTSGRPLVESSANTVFGAVYVGWLLGYPIC